MIDTQNPAYRDTVDFVPTLDGNLRTLGFVDADRWVFVLDA